MVKRVFDIVFAVVFLLVLWPVYVITAIIIKLTSAGPIIYKAERVGKNGRLFTCYKFRSMHVNSGRIHITTLKNDKRIYPFGRFIRSAKIDEFPQMINILLGQMSVVGPRPEDEFNADRVYINEYEDLLSVKPGLTSPGSLYDFTHGEYYENEDSYMKDFLQKKLELELYYVQNKSFLYDIKIIFRTAWIIFLRVIGKEEYPYPPEYSEILQRIKQKEIYSAKEEAIVK